MSEKGLKVNKDFDSVVYIFNAFVVITVADFAAIVVVVVVVVDG